jgi:hypothetical protein
MSINYMRKTVYSAILALPFAALMAMSTACGTNTPNAPSATALDYSRVKTTVISKDNPYTKAIVKDYNGDGDPDLIRVIIDGRFQKTFTNPRSQIPTGETLSDNSQMDEKLREQGKTALSFQDSVDKIVKEEMQKNMK